MDILERFPLIAKTMYAEWDSNPNAYSAHDDVNYKKAVGEREQLVTQLKALLARQDNINTPKELKYLLDKLEEATDDMENIAVYYGFVEGFKLCAKLLLEMIK